MSKPAPTQVRKPTYTALVRTFTPSEASAFLEAANAVLASQPQEADQLAWGDG